MTAHQDTSRQESARLPFASLRHRARSFRAWFDVLTGRNPGPWWWRLSAANALLGWVILVSSCSSAAWIIRETLHTTPTQGPRRLAARAPDPSQSGGFEASALDALRGSGLFMPVRTPDGAQAAGQTNATLAELSKTLQLRGILGGDIPKAILFDLSTKQMHSLAAGQCIGQVRVREVRPSSVVLEWNKETLEIGL